MSTPTSIRRKSLVGLAVALVALGGLGAGHASAGEVTGNGKPIEVKGRSECAYSGLDDIDEDEVPGDPATDDFGRTQNFGQIVKVAGPLGGVPSFTCNPTHGSPA